MALRTHSRPTPIDETGVDMFLAKFQKQALRFLKQQEREALRVRVTDWQSFEDPTWKQKILEITLACDADTALATWDSLGEMFQEAIDKEPESVRESLLDGTSLEVRWVKRDGV